MTRDLADPAASCCVHVRVSVLCLLVLRLDRADTVLMISLRSPRRAPCLGSHWDDAWFIHPVVTSRSIGAVDDGAVWR